MNANISLSYVATTLVDFEAAMALLSALNVQPVVTVGQAPQGAPVSAKGPNETALNAAGQRVRYTVQAAAEHGSKEAYCAAKLRELNLPVPSDAVAQQEEEADHGEAYEPGEIPNAADAWVDEEEEADHEEAYEPGEIPNAADAWVDED